VQRGGRIVVNALAVPGENVLGIDPPQRARGAQAKEWVHAEALSRRAEVGDRPERVGADEDAPLGPPEGNLPPEGVARDREELVRRAGDPPGRDDVVRYTEPRGDRRAVTVVAIEQLEHPARLPKRERPLLCFRPRDRVDEPDAVCGERVRRATHRLIFVEPAEPEVLLVAEAHRG
jgi:hypothetical protein